MTTQALAERNGSGGFSTEQLALIKRTVAKDADDNELALFLYTATSRGLDPLLRQIHAVSRWDDSAKRKSMTIQVGIDGYRLIADRTGAYAGNDDAAFSGAGQFPDSATVTVYKFVQGMRCPFAATARWDEYYPGDKQGFMWRKMPHTMLGKCAEALALRKAFPAEMSGLYVDEEMQQAGGNVVIEEASSRPKQARSRDEFYARYMEVYAKAEEVGIPLDEKWNLLETDTAKQIADKGVALKAAVDAAEKVRSDE